MWTVEVQCKRFQRKVLGTRLEIILVNVATFYPCPKKFLGATLISNALIYWVEQISRQPNIAFVVWVLVFPLTQIYSEKVSQRQKEIPNVQLEEKMNTRKCIV